MNIKLFEIRDEGTCIPAIAIELNGAYHWLLRRAGYGNQRYISLASLNKGNLTYNSFDWCDCGSRTMHAAHTYIIENWDILKNGDMIDIQFILGETSEKKLSEEQEGYAF